MTSMAEDKDISTKIAIIGMDGRFPGARNIAEFWENLRAGRDTTRELTDEELLLAGASRETISDPNYIRRCAYLDDTDKFDARFFGIAPRDAAVMDPQHRLFLEVAWGALEDAGYDASRVPGPVGVFAGSGMSYYAQFNVFTNKKLVSEMGEWLVRHTANDRNFLATLASYKMDITGPSMNVQTACSSALVAVHVACQSLLNGECDFAIAGGSTINFPQRGYKHQEGEILSSDGRCRAFDKNSDGTVFGSGVGAVVLRRLEDALADGDTIDAVICGSAINNDGADKVGFLAPSVSGQTDAILQALEVSQVDAATIDYVETHGTGTVIGDPIEVTSLKKGYAKGSPRPPASCGIGSVKTNIGHLGEAAAIAGLIKVCLAFRHELIPASLHFTAPNPGLELEGSPFYVVAKNKPWRRGEKPRRAAVTALGAGGTNAHMILEEAPAPSPRADEGQEPQMLLLSAKTQTALTTQLERLATFVESTNEKLSDVAFTLKEGRKLFPYRKAVYAQSLEHAALALRAQADQPVLRPAPESPPRLVFMFPGGGAQYANMGRDLYENEPVYRACIDECAKHALSLIQLDIRTLMYCGPEREEEVGARLQSPQLSLPALFATSYALAKLLASWGIKADAMIGHSMGEYVAACLCGVFSVRDGLALVIERGRLFEQVEEGGMLAIQLPESEARVHMGPELAFAAINGPSLCVASGPVAAIDELQNRLGQLEIECTRVRIKVAAHSPLLEPILPAFRSFCEKIEFHPPVDRFVSNLTGAYADPKEVTTPDYWVRHLRSTVQFSGGLEVIFRDGEAVLMEVGPGRTLASVAGAQQPAASGRKPLTLPTLRHPKEQVNDRQFLFDALAKVWAGGVDIDFTSIFGEPKEPTRVHLPTYPFEHERFWIDADRSARGEINLEKRADLADWFCTPTFHEAPLFVSEAERSAPRQWLIFTDNVGVHGRLRAKLNGRVISVRRGLAFSRMDADVFEVNPSRTVDFEDLLSSLDMDRNTPLSILYLWPLTLRRSRVVSHRFGDLQARCFDGLFSLLQAAGDLDWKMSLSVVGNDIFAIGGEGVEPAKSLALGPVRVGSRELKQLNARLIDVDFDPIWNRLKGDPLGPLLNELVGGENDPVVALRGTKRYVEGLANTRIPAFEGTGLVRRPHGVHLITGGFGGIGREVARKLAQGGAPTLILVGTQKLPDRDVWKSADLDNYPTNVAERCRFALELESLGAKVIAECVDLTDADAVAALAQRHSTIDGLFHTAGLLDDAPIQAKSGESAHRIIAAKALSALNLAEAIDLSQLECFVLFSSSSSRLGLRGQCDYTAANAVLDALATRLRAEGIEGAVAINWGTWKDVGMAARMAAHASPALQLVAPPQPMAARTPGASWWQMRTEEHSGRGRARVFTGDFSASDDWLLKEHRIAGGQCVMPGTGYIDLLFSALRENHKDDVFRADDVLFLEPLHVAEGAPRRLQLRLFEDGQFEFSSAEAKGPHVVGQFSQVARADWKSLLPDARDLEELRKRCPSLASLRDGFLPQDFVEFGRRWGNIKSLRYGNHEAVADLELDNEFEADLRGAAVHPALLDMATGGAQALIDNFDQESDFFVPFSYGSALCLAPLTGRVTSHVRFLRRTEETAEFDVSIYDERGEPLFVVQSFLMKKVDKLAFSGISEAPSERPVNEKSDEVNAHFRSLVEQGTTAEDGMEVLTRVIGYRVSPQIFATPVSMFDWLKHTNEQDQTADESAAPSFALNEDRPREAPATRLEEELLELWAELLGVGGLGVTDDFFELGGQSLVAARMFVRIRKKYGVSLPLSALFAAPTIRALGAAIDPEGTYSSSDDPKKSGESENLRPRKAPQTTWSPIVAIQPRGSHPPFFCAPGMGGNPLGQRFLAERLGNQQPFFGLQARGVDGEQTPHTHVEEMAEEYIKAIRSVQPHGPYYLGGFSGGGVVAFEMCQQLTRAGEEIGLLALLDAYNPLLERSSRAYRLKAQLARSQKFGAPHVTEMLKWNVWQPLKRTGAIDVLLGTANEDKASNFESERAALDHKMMSSWLAAEKRYRPKPYAGDAVLFRSHWDLYHGRTDVLPAFDNGWTPLIQGKLRILDVPGTHDSFLLEPNVREVARGLSAVLAESRRSVRKIQA